MHEPQTSKRMVYDFYFILFIGKSKKRLPIASVLRDEKRIGLWNNLYIYCHYYYYWENCIKHIFPIVLINLLVIQKNNTFYSSFIKVIVYLICKGILSQHKNISFGESHDEILFVRIYFTSN